MYPRIGMEERAGDDEDLLLAPAADEGTIVAAAPGRRLQAAAAASLEAQEVLFGVELQPGAERRKRRAMKNRESAGRSRARKQAYMHELEQEVRRLRAENDELRHECQQLKAAAAADEAPAAKRPTLQRVSSATF
ncbi:hypothetical protein ABZP36_031039 [Zizania latifolia]